MCSPAVRAASVACFQIRSRSVSVSPNRSLRTCRPPTGSPAARLAARGYGLTLGVHSRIERFADEVRALVPAGNAYVNRSITGAVVGGPVGAAVGGVAGAAIGGAVSDQTDTVVVQPAPNAVVVEPDTTCQTTTVQKNDAVGNSTTVQRSNCP